MALISHFGVPYIPNAEFLEKHFNFLDDNKINYFGSFYIWRYKKKGVREAYGLANFSTGERIVASTVRKFCLMMDLLDTENELGKIKEFFLSIGFFVALLAIVFFENKFGYRASGGLGWSRLDYTVYINKRGLIVPSSIQALVSDLARKAAEQNVKVSFEIEYIGSDPLLWVEFSKRGNTSRKKCVAIWNGDTVILP